MKSMWCVAAMAAVVLTACGQNTAQTPSENKPAASHVTNTPAASDAAAVAALPQACQQLLSSIEKCVIKYENSAASDALAFRMEFEQLKGQITQGTDAKALEEACTQSNTQMAQMPDMQC